MSETSALELFAVAAPGLEPVVAAELGTLGIHATAEPGGARWSGPISDVFEANLRLRTASRIIARIAQFDARTFYELERRARRVPWERYVPPGGAVRWRVTSHKSRLYHERAIEERLAGAVAQRAGGFAAPADDEAGQLFVVRVLRDRFTVSADTSGELLHRRGYRQAVAKAPIRETLAAAMLLISGWRADSSLLDPFCGSGTIPIEAALMARGVPPGLANPELRPRHYAFENWPEHDPIRWRAFLDRARELVRPTTGTRIQGSDRDAGAIAAAMANAERAGVGSDIEFERRALSAVSPPPGEGWLVSNPPYGVRMGERARLRDLYAALGHFARQRLAGWTIALLSADRQLEGHTGLSFDDALATVNGGIRVRVVVGRVPGHAAA